MPDAYDVAEGRYLQETHDVSGADDLLKLSGAVPEGKVWTILSAVYYPSVAETKVVWFGVYSRAGNTFPVTVPTSIALSASIQYPMVREGMELKLFPGEKVIVLRDSATAGSTMTLKLRLIESDLRIYSQYEPQKDVLAQKFRRGSVTRVLRSVSSGMLGGGPPAPSGPPPGGHRGLPK